MALLLTGLLALPLALGAGLTAFAVGDEAAPPCGHGSLLQVDPDDPAAYDTITAALADAAPGDRIDVAAGTYQESPAIDKDRILLAGAGATTTIRDAGAHNLRVDAHDVCVRALALGGGVADALVADQADGLVVDDVSAAHAAGGILIFDTDGATLDNVTVTDAGVNGVVVQDSTAILIAGADIQSQARGLHATRVSDLTIRHTAIHHVGENAAVIEAATGPVLIEDSSFAHGVWNLWVLASQDVTLRGLDVSGFRDLGVRVDGSQGVRIEGGLFHDSAADANDAVHVKTSRDVEITGVAMRDIRLNGVYVHTTQGVVVEDVDVQRATRGIHMVQTSDATVRDNSVEDTSENGLVLEDMAGAALLEGNRLVNNTWSLWILRSGPVRLADSFIDNWHDRGLRVEGSQDVTIDNVTIGAPHGPATNFGVEVLDSRGVSFVDSEVTNARIDGVLMLRTSDVLVARNWVHDVGRGMHLIEVENVTVADNRFESMVDNGIVLEPGRNVTIEGNTLTDGAIGIWARGGPEATGNVIRANTVTGFWSSGISLDLGAQGHEVQGNLVTGNHRGLKLLDGGGSTPDTVTAFNTLADNTVTGNEYGVWSDNTRGDNTVTGGRVHSNTVCDFFLLNQTSLTVTGVDFGRGATTNDRTKLTLDDNQGPLRPTCDGQQPTPPEDETTITAKALDDHECDGDQWHFVITRIRGDAVQLPGSIHVTWDDGSTAVVPLWKVTGHTAHYATSAHLDGRVVEATAAIHGSWDGQFNLSHGPCGAPGEPDNTHDNPEEPPAEGDDGLQEIRAQALDDHDCDATQWHFVITQTTAEQAPGTVHVEWKDGTTADVPLTRVTGGAAHYQTIQSLDSSVVSSTSFISRDWHGRFVLSHGPC